MFQRSGHIKIIAGHGVRVLPLAPTMQYEMITTTLVRGYPVKEMLQTPLEKMNYDSILLFVFSITS